VLRANVLYTLASYTRYMQEKRPAACSQANCYHPAFLRYRGNVNKMLESKIRYNRYEWGALR
jgi:hypothetical protein